MNALHYLHTIFWYLSHVAVIRKAQMNLSSRRSLTRALHFLDAQNLGNRQRPRQNRFIALALLSSNNTGSTRNSSSCILSLPRVAIFFKSNLLSKGSIDEAFACEDVALVNISHLSSISNASLNDSSQLSKNKGNNLRHSIDVLNT